MNKVKSMLLLYIHLTFVNWKSYSLLIRAFIGTTLYSYVSWTRSQHNIQLCNVMVAYISIINKIEWDSIDSFCQVGCITYEIAPLSIIFISVANKNRKTKTKGRRRERKRRKIYSGIQRIPRFFLLCSRNVTPIWFLDYWMIYF